MTINFFSNKNEISEIILIDDNQSRIINKYSIVMKQFTNDVILFSKNTCCPYCGKNKIKKNKIDNYYYCSFSRSCILNCKLFYENNKTIDVKYCLNCNSIYLLYNDKIYVIKIIQCHKKDWIGYPIFEVISNVYELIMNKYLHNIIFECLIKHNDAHDITINNLLDFQYPQTIFFGKLM